MSHDFDDPGGERPTALPSGFRAAVVRQLTQFGLQVVGWETDGVTVTSGLQPGQQYIGLANLYRRVRSHPRDEWPHLIQDFLEHVTGALAHPAIPENLATITSQLRPRLGKPFDRTGRAHPWGIPLPGTGLEINLVIDFPHTMAYVTPEMLRHTDISAEDLLDLALANLRQHTPADFLERVSEELDIYVGHIGDGYDSARSLLLNDWLPDSPAGFWVTIPSRDEVAAWPVSFEALEKIHVIKLFAQENYRNQAYPVSDEVFWVCNGVWYPFGIRIEEDTITVSPPDEFLTALQQLNKD
jgi:hypothetical protein